MKFVIFDIFIFMQVFHYTYQTYIIYYDSSNKKRCCKLTFTFFDDITTPVFCRVCIDFVVLPLVLLPLLKLPHVNVLTTILISNEIDECD